MKKKQSNRKLWTEEEKLLMIEQYPDSYTSKISELLNRSVKSVYAQARLMGLKKSDAFMKMELEKQANRLKTSGEAYRYPKGKTPVNKGKRMASDVYEKCKATMFKKGNKPHNSKNDWEEGTRNDKSGKTYITIKLPGSKGMKFKHVWLWESVNGKVPKGYNIVFKDGNTKNCIIENLECISNVELLRRNTINRFPEEIKSTIRLVHKLKRAINAKEQN